jgi:methyl-accepting chemotaxis protein
VGRFRDLSIRYSLRLLLGVVSVVLLAVSAANVIHGQTIFAAMATKYTTLAKIVAASSAAVGQRTSIRASGAGRVGPRRGAHIRYAALFDAEGMEIARYPADTPDVRRPAPPQEMGAQFTSDGFLDVVDEVKQADGTVIGRIYLRATTEALRSQIRDAILIALVVFLIALAVAAVLSVALERLISAPILQLAHVAKRVSAEHDFTLRADRRGSDELGTLSTASTKCWPKSSARRGIGRPSPASA